MFGWKNFGGKKVGRKKKKESVISINLDQDIIAKSWFSCYLPCPHIKLSIWNGYPKLKTQYISGLMIIYSSHNKSIWTNNSHECTTKHRRFNMCRHVIWPWNYTYVEIKWAGMSSIKSKIVDIFARMYNPTQLKKNQKCRKPTDYGIIL